MHPLLRNHAFARAITGMGEREDIETRLRQFREMQDRLAKEREARMNKLTQEIRARLEKLFKPQE